MFLNLERLIPRHQPRAHEHFQENVAEIEVVRFGCEGGEGGVGDVVLGLGGGGAEVGEEGEVGKGGEVRGWDYVKGFWLWLGVSWV